MRLSTLKALVLRDLMMPLLCAVLALGGLASARAAGGKALLAAEGIYLDLCLPSGNSDGANHDCDACCLPMPTGLGCLPAPTLAQTALLEHLGIAAPGIRMALPGPNLPWSRGPPAIG